MPRTVLDGTLFTQLNGEFITLNKLAAQLKENIFLQCIKVLKKRRSYGNSYTDPLLLVNKQAAFWEAKALIVTLVVPVTEAA